MGTAAVSAPQEKQIEVKFPQYFITGSVKFVYVVKIEAAEFGEEQYTKVSFFHLSSTWFHNTTSIIIKYTIHEFYGQQPILVPKALILGTALSDQLYVSAYN